MRLTKIGVAEAHLISAVRLRFEGGHLASVYLLAASAREILTTIGEKIGTKTILKEVSEETGTPMKTLIEIVHKFTKFFKHADSDPEAVLEDFEERDVDQVLFVACRDFQRVAKGLPVELQVFVAWRWALTFKRVMDAPLKTQPIVRRCIRLFPGIRAASSAERLRIGLDTLEKAVRDPRLRMAIQRDVILPPRHV
jgi:hypothetical protein